VDNIPFNPISESSKSGDAVTKMDFTYDSFVKEEIIDIDDEVIDVETCQENDEETNLKDNHILEENPVVQKPKLLKTTPRTVVISPKQSKGPIAISKNLSKPVFIPINLSNVKTIKVRRVYLVLTLMNIFIYIYINHNLNILCRLLIRTVKQSMLMHSDDYSP